MAKITMAFSLDDEIDRDILAFFARLPRREKSRTFRLMARAYVEKSAGPGAGGLTLGDLYQVLIEIKRLLKQGVHSTAGNADLTTDQEPLPADDPLLARVEDALSELGL